MARIARNLIMDRWRVQGRRRLVSLSGKDRGSDLDNPATLFAKEDERAAVRAAMSQLKPDDRAALVLRYEADLTYEEMGQALQIPSATAATRVHRARQILRTRLGKAA
jgi:RNA polymerase sigma-70 factor (ECF subfamily)